MRHIVVLADGAHLALLELDAPGGGRGRGVFLYGEGVGLAGKWHGTQIDRRTSVNLSASVSSNRCSFSSWSTGRLRWAARESVGSAVGRRMVVVAIIRLSKFFFYR
jgi:hypothetical protein